MVDVGLPYRLLVVYHGLMVHVVLIKLYIVVYDCELPSNLQYYVHMCRLNCV